MTGAGHLDVGPLRFALRTPSDEPVRYSASGYAGFFSPPRDINIQYPISNIQCSREGGRGSPGGFALPVGLHGTWVGRGVPAEPGCEDFNIRHSTFVPLCELPVEIACRTEVLPAGEPLWRAGAHWAVWEDGTDLLFHVGLKAPEESRVFCRAARDLSRAEVALPFAAWSNGICESPLRYPLDQILSWGMLSRIGGVLLHAAVAVKDGVGHVFTGRSGAGKSTLSGLCQAEGWRILNDDRVIVFRRGNEWRVAGTPWHGSGRFAEAAEAPLGGIFFLEQSSRDFLETMSASQARLALLDVAAVPWFEDSWSQGTLDGLARLVGDVEMARFHFTKTAAAVRVLAERAVGVPV